MQVSEVEISMDLENDAYIKAIEHLPTALQQSYENVVSKGKLQLNDTIITRAILLRLRQFYLSQNATKKFLNKNVSGAASDFFVETVLFFIKAFIETHDLGFLAASERTIRSSNKTLRPDISIWLDENLIACIECKTQLGWNRDKWRVDFLNRDKKLMDKYPDVQTYLLVMTTRNWSGFGDDPYIGKKFFCSIKYMASRN